jgi:sugar lactone lactonase YvrE
MMKFTPRKIIAPVVVGLVLLALHSVIGSSTVGSQAVLELGQPDFTHSLPNFVDGKGFNGASYAAVDKSVTPNRLYVLDLANNRVLGWNSVADLKNGATADLVIGQPDFASVQCNQGLSGVTARTLCFSFTPTFNLSALQAGAIAVDTSGNLFIADSGNNRVLEFDQPFTTDTVADRVYGQPDFTTTYNGISPTNLYEPTGVVVDNSENLYVADSGNNRVLEYNSALVNNAADLAIGAPTLYSGRLDCLYVPGRVPQGPNSLCLDIRYKYPINLEASVGLATDQVGNLYVGDTFNQRVLEYDRPAATGNTTANRVLGTCGSFFANACGGGIGTFGNLRGLAFDNNGALYVGTVRLPDPLTSDTYDVALPEGFGGPAVDASGDVYVPDPGNNRLLGYTAPIQNNETATLELGQPDFVHNGVNFVDGKGLLTPSRVAIDTSVSPNRLYVSDPGNNRVLGYANASALANGATADLVIGQPDLYSYFCNRSSTATMSTLCLATTPDQPQSGTGGIAVDPFGNLYVADTMNNRVLEYDSPFSSDTVADRLFVTRPTGITVDQTGRLFVAEATNNRVLGFSRPLLTATPDLVIGQANFTDTRCNFGGSTNAVAMCQPSAVAVDKSGNLFVSDSGNNRILEFSQPLSNGETASSVLGQNGNFTTNSCGDFCGATSLGFDSSGDLYVTGELYGELYGVTTGQLLEYNAPFSSNSQPINVVGNQPGSCGNPSATTICNAVGLALDANDNLWLADAGNNRVLMFPNSAEPTPTSSATTTAIPTPTPFPTATPTPTPTPTPTAAPTPRVPALVRVSSSSLNFGTVRVGRSKVKGVTLTNTANKKGGATVTFSGRSISGSGEFSVSTTCNGQVGPKGRCSVTVGFSPTSLGSASATITINGNASNSPQTMGVAGTGR